MNLRIDKNKHYDVTFHLTGSGQNLQVCYLGTKLVEIIESLQEMKFTSTLVFDSGVINSRQIVKITWEAK